MDYLEANPEVLRITLVRLDSSRFPPSGHAYCCLVDHWDCSRARVFA